MKKPIVHSAPSRSISKTFENQVALWAKASPVELTVSRDLNSVVVQRPFVPGISLGKLLPSRRLEPSQMLEVAEACLRILMKMHAFGLLHRAITPDKIILPESAEGLQLKSALLVDFALTDSDLQEIDFEYLSPEQTGILNRPVEAPSDLFSLGIVLYEALTGRKPAERPDRLASSLVDPRTLGVPMPRAQAEWLLRLSKNDPSDRYQSAEAALLDLQALREPTVVIGLHDRRSAITTPSWVGFQAELQSADQLLESASGGSGFLALIEGESGSGKSRLLAEIAARASAAGLRVFRSLIDERSSQIPLKALAPIIHALLQETKRDPGYAMSVKEKVGAHWETTVEVFPELEELFGPRTSTSLGPEEQAGARMLRAIPLLLEALGTESRRALIVIDDFQWADALSIQLLSQLPHPFTSVFLASRSTVEVIPQQNHLKLSPLSETEIGELLQSMAGRIEPKTVRTIFQLSAGSPFVAAEVLRGLHESKLLLKSGEEWSLDTHAADRVQTSSWAAFLLQKRLASFSPEAVELLGMAAVLGREFSPRLLARIKGQSIDEIVAQLHELEARHIIWKLPNRSVYTFAHDRLRDTALAQLDQARTREIHHRAGEILEAESPHDHYAISLHYGLAGESAKALEAAMASARDARGKHALSAAEFHYRIAFKASPTREIHEALGDILLLQGKYEEATTELEAALRLCNDDQLATSEIQGKLAEVCFKQGRIEDAAQIIEKALDDLGEPVPKRKLTLLTLLAKEALTQALHTFFPRLFLARRSVSRPEAKREFMIVRLYHRLTYAYYYIDFYRPMWAHLRTMNLSERYSATPELGLSYCFHAVALAAIPWFERARNYGERSVEVYRKLNDLNGRAKALHMQGATLYVGTRYHESIDIEKKALALLDQTGGRWEYNDGKVVIGLAHLRLGNLKEAARQAEEIYSAARAIGDAHSAGFALEIWARATGGRVPADLIERELAVQAGKRGDLMTLTVVREAKALRLIHDGKIPEAVTVLECAQQEIDRAHLRAEYVTQIPIILAMALRLQVETSSTLRSPRHRKSLIRRAGRILQPALRTARGFRTNLPYALREMALLSVLQGKERRARRLLSLSLREAYRQDADYEYAKTLLERAKIGEVLDWPNWRVDYAEARDKLIACGGEFELEPQARPLMVSIADRFTLLMDLGKEIAVSQTREAAERSLITSVSLLFSAEKARIFLIPEGNPPEQTAQLQRIFTLDNSAAFLGRPVFGSQNLLPFLASIFDIGPVRSAIFAPIYVHHELKGVFFIGNSTVDRLYGQDDLRLAEYLCTLAGAAMENVESFAKVKEAIRVRDEFLDMASHELRTPLTPLRLLLELLINGLEQPDPEALPRGRMLDLLHKSEQQLMRMTKLVTQLLDSSQASDAKLELRQAMTDLSQLLPKVIERFRDPSRNTVSGIRIDPLQPGVIGYWDPARIENLVHHLLSNAVKFGEGRPVTLGLKTEGRFARLTVQDLGIGIARENQSRIFERYERADAPPHYGGLGLGLYIARKIVQAHQGEIRVASVPGKGTTFTVDLPLSPPARAN